ncbi:MAG: HD domain-containing protein [Patescibacteria group bacterium]|nr:HD domain-containing protein [Patescibacteria group bacterium]
MKPRISSLIHNPDVQRLLQNLLSAANKDVLLCAKYDRIKELQVLIGVYSNTLDLLLTDIPKDQTAILIPLSLEYHHYKMNLMQGMLVDAQQKVIESDLEKLFEEITGKQGCFSDLVSHTYEDIKSYAYIDQFYMLLVIYYNRLIDRYPDQDDLYKDETKIFDLLIQIGSDFPKAIAGFVSRRGIRNAGAYLIMAQMQFAVFQNAFAVKIVDGQPDTCLAANLVRSISNQGFVESEDLISFLSKVITTSHSHTAMHSKRTGYLVKFISNLMGENIAYSQLMYYAGVLHDIGKLFVSEHALNSPKALTEAQRKMIEKHGENGAELHVFLGISEQVILDGTRDHHVPFSDNPSIDGQYVAIADTYDALASKRSYKPAFSFAKTGMFQMAEAGILFEILEDMQSTACPLVMRKTIQSYSVYKQMIGELESNPDNCKPSGDFWPRAVERAIEKADLIEQMQKDGVLTTLVDSMLENGFFDKFSDYGFFTLEKRDVLEEQLIDSALLEQVVITMILGLDKRKSPRIVLNPGIVKKMYSRENYKILKGFYQELKEKYPD